MTGEISTLRSGYGFIAGQDGVNRFFHRSELKGVGFAALQEGQAVTFDASEGDRGPRATTVTPLAVLNNLNSSAA